MDRYEHTQIWVKKYEQISRCRTVDVDNLNIGVQGHSDTRRFKASRAVIMRRTLVCLPAIASW